MGEEIGSDALVTQFHTHPNVCHRRQRVMAGLLSALCPGGLIARCQDAWTPHRGLCLHTPLCMDNKPRTPPCVLLSAPTPVVEPLTEPLLDPGWGSDSRPVWPLGL